MKIDRRNFTKGLAGALGGGKFMLGGVALAGVAAAAVKSPYKGPNVIIIRFGGGVRRLETIDPKGTYAPFLRHQLTRRGVLIPHMTISDLEGVETSHAEGTINILTGRYLAYRDAGSRFLAQQLEPTQPTLFEYFRRAFDVPVHRTLLINGEDRPQEEYFTYGVHRHYGVSYRSETLSLHRYKLFQLGNIIRAQRGTDEQLATAKATFKKLMTKDYRGTGPRQPKAIETFWRRWQHHFGNSGFVNPRGDRLLTELALRAISELRPQLMMINYQDPDYVHWGNASHYTRAIAIIDQGLAQLVKAVDADPAYRGRTVFVVVPDCGRDSNPLLGNPLQHHFNSRSAHEIWALIFGPGIARNKILDKPVDQTAIAATVGAIMGFRAKNAEGSALEDIFT